MIVFGCSVKGTEFRCSIFTTEELAQQEQWQNGEQLSASGWLCVLSECNWKTVVSCPFVSCASAQGTKFSTSTTITQINEKNLICSKDTNIFFLRGD